MFVIYTNIYNENCLTGSCIIIGELQILVKLGIKNKKHLSGSTQAKIHPLTCGPWSV